MTEKGYNAQINIEDDEGYKNPVNNTIQMTINSEEGSNIIADAPFYENYKERGLKEFNIGVYKIITPYEKSELLNELTIIAKNKRDAIETVSMVSREEHPSLYLDFVVHGVK